MSNSFVTPWTVACQVISVHGISWAKILEWVDISLSRTADLHQETHSHLQLLIDIRVLVVMTEENELQSGDRAVGGPRAGLGSPLHSRADPNLKGRPVVGADTVH